MVMEELKIYTLKKLTPLILFIAVIMCLIYRENLKKEFKVLELTKSAVKIKIKFWFKPLYSNMGGFYCYF